MEKCKTDYILIALSFDCNNNCIGCMIGELKQKLVPITVEKFEEIIKQESKNYSNLILSGAEITLNRDLIKYIFCAKKYFKIIRIQTNGRKLKDKQYCQELIKTGINEFFITINGSKEIIHDSYSRIKGSFKETIKGIKNLNKLNSKIITNIVITKNNIQNLPKIIRLINNMKIKDIEIWNYLPMSKNDEHDLMVKNTILIPFLIKSLNYCDVFRINVTLKYFPKCLLEGHKNKLDNKQPKTIINNIYWDKFKQNKFRCLFKNQCIEKDCFGLPIAYINKFGWDENIKPIL